MHNLLKSPGTCKFINSKKRLQISHNTFSKVISRCLSSKLYFLSKILESIQSPVYHCLLCVTNRVTNSDCFGREFYCNEIGIRVKANIREPPTLASYLTSSFHDNDKLYKQTANLNSKS